VLFVARLDAQSFSIGRCNESEGTTSNKWLFGDHVRICELRRTTLPLVDGQLTISGKNGGIEVIGEDRQDIALEAQVVAQGSSRENAESIEREVKILTGTTIQAEGPQFSLWSNGSWSVNYHLHVPRHLTANLHTENGGIEVTNIDGKINAVTTNGGLTLHDLAGEVHASTVNGGLNVILVGNQWQGGGLFAKSVNGGVFVKAPDHYSAHLVAETANGRISLGFPITLQGNIRNHIDTNIGQGGATVQFQTVNGGVSIGRN
jgi:hypothetical protein